MNVSSQMAGFMDALLQNIRHMNADNFGHLKTLQEDRHGFREAIENVN
jgi:hypothetical protein